MAIPRDGDFYINDANQDFYLRQNGVWVRKGNIRDEGSSGIISINPITSMGFDMASVVQRIRYLAPDPYTLGFDITVAVERIRLLAAAMQFGYDATAAVQRVRELNLSMDFGLDMTTVLTHSVGHLLTADMTFGFDQASPLFREKLLAASMALGFTEAATIDQIKALTATIALGSDETATILRSRLLSAAMDYGYVESVALTHTPGAGSIVLNHTANAGGAPGNATVVISATAGDVLLVYACAENAASSTPTITVSSANLVWSKVGEAAASSGTIRNIVALWYAVAGSNLTNENITVSHGGIAEAVAAVANAWSGVDNANPFEAAISFNSNFTASTTTVTSPNVTTVTPDAVIAAFAGNIHSAIGVGTGFTDGGSKTQGGSSNGAAIRAQYKKETTPASGISIPYGNTSSYWAAGRVALHPSGITPNARFAVGGLNSYGTNNHLKFYDDTYTAITDPATMPTGIVGCMAASNTGRYFAMSNATDLYVYDCVPTIPVLVHQVAGIFGSNQAHLAWSHDDARLAVVNSAVSLTIYRTDTWATVTGPSIAGAQPLRCDWSPDGTRFGVACNVSAYFREFDATTMSAVTAPASPPPAAVVGIHYSPDGAHLALQYGGGTPGFLVYERSGMTKLSDPATMPSGSPSNRRGTPRWNHAGDTLVLATNSTPFIWIYSLSGSTLTKVADPADLPSGNCIGGCFSADDTKFIAVSASGDLIIKYTVSGWTKDADLATMPSALVVVVDMTF